eukprot:gene2589-2831_t
MSDFESTLNNIAEKLEQKVEDMPSHVSTLLSLINSLEGKMVSLPVFLDFLGNIRPLFVSGNTTNRSLILRTIRFCIRSAVEVKALISEEVHFLIVESLERDSEYVIERIQALKAMDTVRRLDPGHYPVAFGRSIIAVAASKDDALRKICMESLRELSLANTALVASLQGFATLIDAILEPISQDLADNITMTIIFLLNDPVTRRVVEPCVDLRMLLAPFTDLDTDPVDLEPKWNAAKASFSLLMKSWAGIILIAADNNALGMLVNMLKDPKVPLHTQNVVLDTLSEVFSNICFKQTYSSRRHRHEFYPPSQGTSTFLPPPSRGFSTAAFDPIRQSRATSESDMYRDSLTSSPGDMQSNGMRSRTSFTSLFSSHTPSLSTDSAANASVSGGNGVISAPHASRGSISSYLFGGSRGSTPAPSSKQHAIQPPQPPSSSLNRRSFLGIAHLNAPSRSASNPLESICENDHFSEGFAVDEIDPVYNLLDNVSALLCCAFLHVDLINSLFVLSTEARVGVAVKSRKLLVNFLRILSEVLPENACAELLTNPTLLDISIALGSNRSANRAYKSSQLLMDLADTFSVMPCKQTSGAHSSNLSQGVSVKGRNRSITGTSSMTSSLPGNFSVQPSNRSNFLPLNIRTLFDLAEEIKISSSIATAGQPAGLEISSSIYCSSNFRSMSVLSSLRNSLTPVVDKVDFARQMEASKVTGKEGKEPFKWDWMTISDMLEYSFQHPDRLTEALKTKWVRRISGFYRCSVEEKGYFANLEWEPTNLQYLECASNLYSVLLREEAGLSFLTSDRRGMLFNEMAQEIAALVSNAASRNPVSSASKSVFRVYGCTALMGRELFTLLGRIVRTPGSKKLLEHTNIFEHLSRLGQYKSLDYVTRLVITSLCFTDGGLLSRYLLQMWTTSPSISIDFRHYLHNLLRVMIQALSENEDYKWSIEAIVNQLSLEDYPDKVLYRALEEAIHSKSSLRLVIGKRPALLNDPDAQHILLRFLSVPEGIRYLTEKNWLDGAFAEWSSSKCKDYVAEVEDRLSTALIRPPSELLSNLSALVSPIPIRTPEIVKEITARRDLISISAKTNENPSRSSSRGGDPNAPLGIDLQGLLRIPWNIEVKVTKPLAQNQQPSESLGSPGDYLRVDTFLDASDLTSPLSFDVTCDTNRIVKVRGILLDSKGNPCGQPIPQNKIISNTLLAGICPINRSGEISSITDFQSQRRRASTTTNVAHREESKSTNRPSFSNVATSSQDACVSADTMGLNEVDMPISLGQEHLCDWVTCKPNHRQGNVTEMEDGLFAVTIPNEPVVWIFSRRATGVTGVSSTRLSRPGSTSRGELPELWFDSSRSNRMDTSRSGGLLYLVEVQYFFRLETGKGMFVPMPRHMYGELARTIEGCAELSRRNIVFDLLSKSRQLYEQMTKIPMSLSTISGNDFMQALQSDRSLEVDSSTTDLRSCLWSLGQIGSSELGFAAILNIDPSFVEWCIDCICNSPHLGVRGTFFYVLGLISRTSKGNQILYQNKWDGSFVNGNSAVAIPRQPQILFKIATTVSKSDSNPSVGIRKARLTQNRNKGVGSLPYLSMSTPPSSIKLLTPFIPSGSVNMELEILNLIAKMPGVVLYRECKARLDTIRRQNPQVFDKHSLYVDVHRILESYSFKLTARRDILALFSTNARLKALATFASNSSSTLANGSVSGSAGKNDGGSETVAHPVRAAQQ